jgi:hypothetical protein
MQVAFANQAVSVPKRSPKNERNPRTLNEAYEITWLRLIRYEASVTAIRYAEVVPRIQFQDSEVDGLGLGDLLASCRGLLANVE